MALPKAVLDLLRMCEKRFFRYCIKLHQDGYCVYECWEVDKVLGSAEHYTLFKQRQEDVSWCAQSLYCCCESD